MQFGVRSLVTIKDIALEAGTSLSTVSRVLNGLTIRDPELAIRIQEVAQRLNYRPNMAGRNLRMGSDNDFGPVFDVRSTQQLRTKQMIAAQAAKLVRPSDVIVLDSGSTIAQMATYLPAESIVYTNSLAVLQPAARRGIHVHLAPGLYVPAMAAVFGEETTEYFHRHKSNVYFLSSARVDVRTGLFNFNPLTHSVKGVALEHAERKVLVVHHEKFCDASLDSYARLTDIDVLVTDFVPDQYREAIFSSGLQVIEADPQPPYSQPE